MSFLLATNVLPEFRKRHRAGPRVMAWLRTRRSDELYISVLTLGELRRGVERIRYRGDTAAAKSLEEWLAATGVGAPVGVALGIVASTATVVSVDASPAVTRTASRSDSLPQPPRLCPSARASRLRRSSADMRTGS